MRRRRVAARDDAQSHHGGQDRRESRGHLHGPTA
jgi:hypothetical protein